ncbi:MAG TPA: hypothetical protein VMM18_15825 [Gemmatimonadaceae bacterium]|nr:hypothetical protein [Gemmatimonadaceae bacterium]
MQRLTPAVVLTCAFSACADWSPLPMEPEAGNTPVLARASSTTTHFETPFTAVAQCGTDIGPIRFTGIISGVDHTTVDGRGEQHRTRAFRVQGLTGVNLMTGEAYTVIGGAEMLSWNTPVGQVPGVPLRSNHAGTLVFDPVDGGSKVIAHHAIRYIEDGTGEVVLEYHAWSCVRQGERAVTH